MKRKIALVLAVVVALMLCGGCGQAEAPAQETRITLIHDMNEEPAIQWLEKAAETFSEANPGTVVEMEVLSSDDYNTMLRNKAAADDFPDIFFMDDMNKKYEYIEGGYCVDIAGEGWLAESIREDAINAVTVDGKVYCLPLFIGGMFVTYNADLFEQAGVGVPETYSDFLAACQTLKDAGITPIAAGFQDSWTIFSDEQCDSVVTTVKYDRNNRLELEAGATTWVEDKGHYSEVLQRLGERAQYYNDDPFGTDWNTAVNMLAIGDAAMILNGSWTMAAVKGVNPDANIDIFPLPLTEDPADALLPLRVSQGGFAVYQESANKEVAVKFLQHLATREMGEAMQEMKGEISTVMDLDVPEDSDLYAVKKYMDENRVFDWSGYSELFVSDELQGIVTDTLTEFLMDDGRDVDGYLALLDERFATALNASK